MGKEGAELLGISLEFPADCEDDEILKRRGDRKMMDELEKVFFLDGPNALGHSYVGLMRGPGNRSDLSDVVELLQKEPDSKRAVVTLNGRGDGKVPCLNLIQFLLREGVLRTIYFARAQDAYKKFYGDARCVAKMARKVAGRLGVPASTVVAFIGSSHIYHADAEAIRCMVEQDASAAAADRTGGTL